MIAIPPHNPLKKENFSMHFVMERGASEDQVQHMVGRIEALGLRSHVIYGTERTVQTWRRPASRQAPTA
jgi:hypothetical protein